MLEGNKKGYEIYIQGHEAQKQNKGIVFHQKKNKTKQNKTKG